MKVLEINSCRLRRLADVSPCGSQAIHEIFTLEFLDGLAFGNLKNRRIIFTWSNGPRSEQGGGKMAGFDKLGFGQ